MCTVVEIKHLLRLAQLEAEGSDSEQEEEEESDVEDQQDEPMEERQDEIGLGIVVVA